WRDQVGGKGGGAGRGRGGDKSRQDFATSYRVVTTRPVGRVSVATDAKVGVRPLARKLRARSRPAAGRRFTASARPARTRCARAAAHPRGAAPCGRSPGLAVSGAVGPR